MYDQYCIELLGTARDLRGEIASVNPSPDPYVDAAAALSAFANARVYQDYAGYVDETLKVVDNRLIGAYSDVLAPTYTGRVGREQSVTPDHGMFVWRIGLDSLYGRFDADEVLRTKVLLFNKKCFGKSPYLFCDLSAIAGAQWTDLRYDADDASGQSQVISAADCVFGYHNRVVVQSTLDGEGEAAVGDSNHVRNVAAVKARLTVGEARDWASLDVMFLLEDASLADYTFVPEGQLQAVFLDTRNLDVFNYFHYLNAYGAVRVIDYFKTFEELQKWRETHGDGWVIARDVPAPSEEDLENSLRTYYEYRGRNVPLSSVDLSEFDSLSDVYILQGSRRLQFKVDEDFRYELSSPSYFYPTVNAKFPVTPAQYAAERTTFREGAQTSSLNSVFGERNVFMFDFERPDDVLASFGRVDIPDAADPAECALAYEDYLDPADGLSGFRNCDLYAETDPRVMQFMQFAADGVSAEEGYEIDIPDGVLSGKSFADATEEVGRYAESRYGVSSAAPSRSEAGVAPYSQSGSGFTMDGGSLSSDQVAELTRVYVNFAKYGEPGSEKIRLYFNYMNYLDSPYIKVEGGRTYVDTIPGTYLRLDQDEDGVLDVVTQFRHYAGGRLLGYRNVKTASYRVWNVSDDKPKFVVKKIDGLQPGDASDGRKAPNVVARVCDVVVDVSDWESDPDSPAYFDLVVRVDSDMPLSAVRSGLDYPADFMRFEASSGDGWSIEEEAPGYVDLRIEPGAVARIPSSTLMTKSQLFEVGEQSLFAALDAPVLVGANGEPAQSQVLDGEIAVTSQGYERSYRVLFVERREGDPEDEQPVLDIQPAQNRICMYEIGEDA